MKNLIVALCLFVLPLKAIDVTISIGGQSTTFAISGNDVAAVQALRLIRLGGRTTCEALRTDGAAQDCSTNSAYLAWRVKKIINFAKKDHPQGQDAVDAAAIKTLRLAIEDRKVE